MASRRDIDDWEWDVSMQEEMSEVSDLDVLVVTQVFLLAAGLMMFPQKKDRNPSVFEQRLHWEAYCMKHTTRGTFMRRLRMSKQSFNLLLSYLWDFLMVNESQAKIRGGSICPELCLYCTLRWLAGGSYLDIIDIAGISKSSFYRVVWKTIVAIVLAPELALKWPSTEYDVQETMSGFVTISESNAINNCAGVADGFLLRIKVPSRKEAKNVRSFFSGHYQCYGLNIQAVCDHHCRFTFLAVAGPGVSKDRDAARQCGLNSLISKLPNGVCGIGDAAYEPSENMVPIYQGVDKLKAKYDNFNFFASQLRIRIEMAFGLMTTKWGILQRPLGVSLRNVKWMVQAIGRLQNFVINQRLKEAGTSDGPMSKAVSEGRAYLPSTPHEANGDPVVLQPLFDQAEIPSLVGHSELREAMAARVQRLSLERPVGNRITRKRKEVTS